MTSEEVAKLEQRLRDAIAAELAALTAERDRLREALKPFAECAAPFGPDWSDADEIACEPLDEEDPRHGDGCLLFAFKVRNFRNARAALKATE